MCCFMLMRVPFPQAGSGASVAASGSSVGGSSRGTMRLTPSRFVSLDTAVWSLAFLGMSADFESSSECQDGDMQPICAC